MALRHYDRPRGLALQGRRSPQPLPPDLIEAFAPIIPSSTGLSDMTLDVMSALRLVRDHQARAVMAFTVDGFTDAEIGDQLGLDPQRVRNLRTKARNALARRLAHYRAQTGGDSR